MLKHIFYLILFLSLISIICKIEIQNEKGHLKLDHFINEYMKENKIVGLGLSIVSTKKNLSSVQIVKGYGFQNKEQGITIDPTSSLFRWASLSKMIASILAFKLRREGIINFDVPIERYYSNYTCPNILSIHCLMNQTHVIYNKTDLICNNSFAYAQIPKELREITIRDLLSHRAGILDYSNSFKDPVPVVEDINNPEVNIGFEWAVNYFKDDPLINIPGQNYNYSTFGYNLLGVVLLKATGYKTYEELIKDKLNISRSQIINDKHWENNSYPNRCVGYNNLTITNDTDVSYKLPGGGFMSTLKICGEFIDKLVNSEKYLKKEEKIEAWRSLEGSDYGLGFMIFNSEYNKSRLFGVGHTGSQEKTKNVFIYYPYYDTFVLAMSNSENFNQTNFLNNLEALIFK